VVVIPEFFGKIPQTFRSSHSGDERDVTVVGGHVVTHYSSFCKSPAPLHPECLVLDTLLTGLLCDILLLYETVYNADRQN